MQETAAEAVMPPPPDKPTPVEDQTKSLDSFLQGILGTTDN